MLEEVPHLLLCALARKKSITLQKQVWVRSYGGIVKAIIQVTVECVSSGRDATMDSDWQATGSGERCGIIRGVPPG